MSENIKDARTLLFEAIRAVRSGELELDRARTLNELTKTLIDTAKVEVEYIKAAGAGDSEFLQSDEQQLPQGIAGIRRHRLAG